MSSDHQAIEHRFSSLYRRSMRKSIRVWTEAAETLVAPLERELQRAAGLKAESVHAGERPEDVLSAILDRLKEMDLPGSEIFHYGDWPVQSGKFLEGVPGRVVLEIDDSFWHPAEDDPRLARAWKLSRRGRRHCRRAWVGSGNLFQRIFRKSPKSIPVCLRNVPLRAHVERDLVLSGARFLHREWQYFLSEFAHYLAGLHQQTEEIKNNILAVTQVCVQNQSTDTIPANAKAVKAPQHPIISRRRAFEDYMAASRKRLRAQSSESRSRFMRQWPWAGTPFNRLCRTALRRERKKVEEAEERTRAAWLTHLSGERDEWCKDMEISLLQFNIVRRCAESGRRIRAKVTEMIVPTFESGFNIVSQAQERFKATRTFSRAELRKILTEQSREVLVALRTREMPKMMDAVLHAHLDQHLEEYLTHLKEELGRLSVEHIVFVEQDMEGPISRSRTERIPLRQLAEKEIMPRLTERHRVLDVAVRADVERILRDISEIDQIVEYNLDTAFGVLAEGRGDEVVLNAEKVAAEGLDRAGNQLRKLMEILRGIDERCRTELMDISREFIARMQDLEDNEKVMQLRLRLARASAREKIRTTAIEIWHRAAVEIKKAIVWIRQGSSRVTFQYRRLRRLAGLAVEGVALEERMTLFLSDGIKKIGSLPYVYQRLFRIEPLNDKRFLSGRSVEIDGLKAAITAWKNGQRAATALVGEKGSGRTSIINMVEMDVLGSTPPIRVQLANTVIDTLPALLNILNDGFDRQAEVLEDLESQLVREEEKLICVVEDLQNLYLRTVDGFDALERFLLFISRTSENVLWLVTCTLYTWRYLDRVLGISKYFQKNIELSTLSRQEIESIVLKRHRISGYRLKFQAGEQIQRSRKFKNINKPEAQQAYLQEHYFERLHQVAAGNIAVAMLFWLVSIDSVDKEELQLSSDIHLDYSFVHNLPDIELFTLAALLQHESLSEEEHARIFGGDLEESQRMLQRMYNRSMLTCTNGRYQIHRLLFRSVVQVLKTKNIIH